MSRWKSWRSYRDLSIGLGLGLLVGVGMMIGAMVALRADRRVVLPETLLHATATHGTDNFAIATGQIGSTTEGVFFLDYLSGDLSCAVIYSRTGTFGALYRANVTADITPEQGKLAKYMMVTGRTEFKTGFQGNQRPALSVVYIVDAQTGAFACYGVPWNDSAANAGQPQGGPLVLLQKGRARDLQSSVKVPDKGK